MELNELAPLSEIESAIFIFQNTAFECLREEYRKHILTWATYYVRLMNSEDQEEADIGYRTVAKNINTFERFRQCKETIYDFLNIDFASFNPDLSKINPKFVNSLRMISSRNNILMPNLAPMKLLNDSKGFCAKNLLIEFKKLCIGAGFQSSTDETVMLHFESLKHRLKDYSLYAFRRFVDYSNFERNAGIREKQGLDNYDYIITKIAEYQYQADILMNNLNYIKTN